MAEQTCYLGDQTTTKAKRTIKTSWYFQKNYLFKEELCPTYPRNRRNKTKE